VGHEVVGLDFDATTIDGLNRGVAPVLEAGLEELIKRGTATRALRFSASIAEAVRDVEVLWVAYDTPVDDDDNADVEFVIRQIELVLLHLPIGATVLVSSQMPVGSIRRLESIAASKYAAQQLEFAYSPENLRLGKALEVFLKPDRIVVGVRSAETKTRLDKLLRPISESIEWMSVESAEMTKHAINAFLATSVTFANEIASICELVGADAKQVERGLKSENRIGPKAYLSPGGAFAGGTLARDVTFLNQVGEQQHLATPLLASVRPSNNEHKKWARRKLQAVFPDLSQITVALWGLTYKAGTDTLRRSMAVELCGWLIQQGAKVQVHDPVVTELPSHWRGKVQRYDEPLSALVGVQALVVATEWPLYRNVKAEQLAVKAPDLVVLDANRFLFRLAQTRGLRYVAVGTPDMSSEAQ
jgi:nucleotide sugar dehydrogenase